MPFTLAVALGPDLPGAACVGLAPTFDLQLDQETADERAARHAAATRVCRHCPALAACRHALAGAEDPSGVWAGQVCEPSPAARRAPAA